MSCDVIILIGNTIVDPIYKIILQHMLPKNMNKIQSKRFWISSWEWENLKLNPDFVLGKSVYEEKKLMSPYPATRMFFIPSYNK